MPRYRVGCDIGGTFTDIIVVNDETGDMHIHKILSSPPHYERAVVEGTKKILENHHINPAHVTMFCHSSTVALNTLVEKKGEVTALLTTAGFRDVLEIGRGTRLHEYDLFQTKVKPLVPRQLRFNVPERVNWKGEVIRPLDEDRVREIAYELKEKGITSIAVVYLHSYANPVHEKKTKEILLSINPGAHVSVSSEINPIYREYERTSSTVVNAYIAKKCINYITNLERDLEEIGLHCNLYINQSSGGLMRSTAAKERTIHMLMAGPAAGVSAAAYYSRLCGFDRIIALDIGGTTQLISLIESSSNKTVLDATISGYPVSVPVVDVRAIGAGGGSIARVESGGRLQVGPDSAGAAPGPVCYGLGGTEPTVTDADVVLGYLNPDYFLGGEIRLNKNKAEEAIYEKIAKPLGMTVYQAASGIIEVVNSERIGSIRKLLIEQGYDPRDFAMVAFGGAGPVHAAELAKELELKAVVVPSHPGLSSPVGCLSGELRRDFVQTVGMSMSDVDFEALQDISRTLYEGVISSFGLEGVQEENLIVEFQGEMKYRGQLREITVAIPNPMYGIDPRDLTQRFYKEHHRLFGYHSSDEDVVLVNLRVIGRHQFPAVRLKEFPEGSSDSSMAFKGRRPVYFKEYSGLIECPLYDRSLLSPTNVIEGPAVVEEYDSTTVIYPGQRAVVDTFCNLIITNEKSGL